MNFEVKEFREGGFVWPKSNLIAIIVGIFDIFKRV